MKADCWSVVLFSRMIEYDVQTNFRIFKLEGMQFSPVAQCLSPLLRRGQIHEDRKGIRTVATLTEITAASTRIKLRLQVQS
jgi:hypothetical protein